jgi:hypothetical protein
MKPSIIQPACCALLASLLVGPAPAQMVNNVQPASSAFAADVARSGTSNRQILDQALNTSVYSTLDPASAASAVKRVEDSRRAAERQEALAVEPFASRRFSGVDDSALVQARDKVREKNLAYLRASGHAAALEALHATQ